MTLLREIKEDLGKSEIYHAYGLEDNIMKIKEISYQNDLRIQHNPS